MSGVAPTTQNPASSLIIRLLPGNFPSRAPQRRPVWPDCAHHQVVRANRRDFLRHRIARHFRSLPRQGPVSVGGPAILRGNSWRVSPKVSGRKFPFPRLLFATCPPRPISNGPWGFEPRHLSRFGWMDQPLAGRQTSKGGSFLTPAPAPGVRARATDPARPSAGRRDA